MKTMKPFCYYGSTEWLRFGIGFEFIGGNGKYGLMLTFLWWFILPGLEAVEHHSEPAQESSSQRLGDDLEICEADCTNKTAQQFQEELQEQEDPEEEALRRTRPAVR